MLRIFIAFVLLIVPAFGQSVGGRGGEPSAPFTNVNGQSGIDCTGATESTTGFQTLLGSIEAHLKIPSNCTLIIDHLTLPPVIEIVGGGDTSIIKQKDSAGGHLLYQSNLGSFNRLAHFKIDGNYTNNGGDDAPNYIMFRLVAAGKSATQPALVVIDDVTFVNGGQNDESTYYPQSAYPTYWVEKNVRHYGGAIGTSNSLTWEVSAFAGVVKGSFENISIDLQRLPTGTNIGRSGYAFYLYSSDETDKHNLTINGLTCNDTGKSGPSISGGCLTFHEGVANSTVTNLTSTNAVGDGMSIKTDSQNVTFTNVTVTNLAASAVNGAEVGACFAIFQATSYYPHANSGVTLNGLTCTATTGGGIIVDGRNAPTPTELFSNGTFSNYTITCNNGGAHYGVDVTDGKNLTFTNGSLTSCAESIRGEYVGPLTTGPMTFSGVTLTSSGAATFDATTTANGLTYAP